MYAILHLPTGKLLARVKSLDCQEMAIYRLDYEGKTLFYSKKDAEKYKRKFLIFYYLIIKHYAKAMGNLIIFPKKLPRFLKKRNRFGVFKFSHAAYDLGNRSLDFWLSSAKDNIIIVSDVKEFVIVKV